MPEFPNGASVNFKDHTEKVSAKIPSFIIPQTKFSFYPPVSADTFRCRNSPFGKDLST